MAARRPASRRARRAAASPKVPVDRPANLGNPRMGWGSDVVAEVVRRLDLKYIALVPGASYRGFHDSIVNYLGNTNPQMLVCLHEEHAVAIADGYARITETPMAVALHSNVGLMHGTMPIFNAWCGRAPVVIFGATGPVDADKRRPWIDWIHTAKDQASMIRHYTKWDDQPASPQAAVESILRANKIAATRPQGPVYVCLDADLQESPLEEEVNIPDVGRYLPPAPAPAPAAAVRDTLRRIKAAKFPIFMMGRVSRDLADWKRRVRLAEALGVPVLTDTHNAAAFPTEHPLHKAAPAFRPQPDSAALIKKADLIVAFDWLDLAGTLRTVFSASQTDDPVRAEVIECALESTLHNGWSMDYQALPAVDLPILADPDVFIGQLLDALGAQAKRTARQRPALARIKHWTQSALAREKVRGDAPLEAVDLAHTITAFAKENTVCLARLPLGWPGHACRFDHPLDYLGNDAGGAVGTGPGHTVGAALALKDSGRMAVGVLGDGDFLMGVSALWTASHMDLPTLIVVANNRSYFNDEAHQERVARERGRPPENRWIGQRIDEPAVDL
ncbi:MAG: thiamine pyrophosphate-binding protein, partial [Alphaproteobacteria bacterium]|nr:thiamine pyrophosphate-binding protein [Alphaproteobacteria bacterium]